MLACWDNTRYLCTMATGLRQRGAGLCAMRARTKHLLIGVLRVSTYLMPVASSRANTRTKECTGLCSLNVVVHNMKCHWLPNQQIGELAVQGASVGEKRARTLGKGVGVGSHQQT